MSVTFTTLTDSLYMMQRVWGEASLSNVVGADGETSDMDTLYLAAVIYDDSDALSTYEDAQIEADADWTQPDYTDGYAIAIETTYTNTDGQSVDYGVCVTGTGPSTTDADDVEVAGDAFTSCVYYETGTDAFSSVTTEALAADGDDITAYTAVTEADNIGYNASWVCANEATSAQWLTDAGLEQVTTTWVRFLPALGEDGAYTSTDLRFDADTVEGKLCFMENYQAAIDNGDDAEFSCLQPRNLADDELLWAGASTIAAGAVVAIAATLF